MNFKKLNHPTIYVIHEHDEWLSPLKQAFEARNIPYIDCHMGEGGLDLSCLPPEGIFYNRMSASSHTRGHEFSPELTLAVLHWLELSGRRVINGSNALHLEVSKIAQYRALKEHDIQTPRTVAALGKSALLEQAKMFPTPFLTKHNRAGKGLGIAQYDSAKSLQLQLEEQALQESRDGITLLQERIISPDSTITRVEFIGGKFHYAVQVDTSSGFQLCPADQCQIDGEFCPTTAKAALFKILPEFSNPLLEKYSALLKTYNAEIAAFEFIQDKDGNTYTFDINMNTNYNSEAEITASNVQPGMEAIAEFLNDELLKSYSS